MSKPLNPQRLIIDGRPVVNRDWIREHTGASAGTAARWYKLRNEQPAESAEQQKQNKAAAKSKKERVRHPEKACTIQRVDYYDEEQFLAFYEQLLEDKRAKLTPVDPALWAADPEDRISINQAAKWLGFDGPAVIRKYLRDNPGYFPAPVGTVEGPSGRQIPAFRCSDLQDFARSRTGRGRIGAAGRKPGPQPDSAAGRPASIDMASLTETALQVMLKEGGYHYGLAVRLAAEYEGHTLDQWERAVRTAREQHPTIEKLPSPQVAARTAAAVKAIREAGGWHRGLARELARQHDESADVWERAVAKARAQLDEQPTK